MGNNQMNIKWCCKSFKHSFESAGCRGFSIIVEKKLKMEPVFFLQFRGYDLEDELQVNISSEIFVELISQVPITYCLWCGKNLNKWYRKKVSLMTRPEYSLDEL